MKNKISAGQAYTLGLDIGMASVGWCVLGENRVIDLGVRCFDKAETAKEGEALNKIRRDARLMRNRLKHRATRLKKIARLLRDQGLITSAQFFKQTPATVSLWRLRVEALERALSAEEWARVIYHIAKHRGFHWANLAEEKAAEAEEGKSESGKVKKALSASKQLRHDKNYQTAAQMVLAEFPDAQRNKGGDYGKSLSRVLIGEELQTLFARQRALGNPHAHTALEEAILGSGDCKTGLFWQQAPALSGEQLLAMLGKCTFERSEYRAPKASFTAERHVWLTRLNNLRLIENGTSRSLTPAERALALPLPYQQASDLTYKQLGASFIKAGFVQKDQFRFGGLAYPSAKQLEDKAKNPEEQRLIKLPAWQNLQSAFKKAGLETEWQSLAGQAHSGRPEILDDIAWILSIYKEDDEARAELESRVLPALKSLSAQPEKIIDTLLAIRFDQFHALSLKALRKIVPFMETGERYDEACLKAGYHHSQNAPIASGKTQYLPPFYSGRDADGRMKFDEDADVPRNPVVLRALNQARKVANALIREYGSPINVHIELARDLSKPFDERSKIRKDQEAFRDSNEKLKAKFAEEFDLVGSPKGRDFEKWRLYHEQSGQCAYSQQPIDTRRLLEPKYLEVDHALPYSRSFDDSKNNKVLVLVKENQNKGNRTPYEYLGGAEDSPRWQRFVAWVDGNKAYRQAKRNRLLRKDFGGEEAEKFRDRNLNDTRYICRFFKNYVERHLHLAADRQDNTAKRCVVVSGQLTSLLRARWGLAKTREESDRHHALDATIVAACSHGFVKRMSDYARRKELALVQTGFVDLETGEIVNPAMLQQLQEHFPEPWPHFRHELEARLKIDNPALLREELARLGTYSEEALSAVKPLFVSRAPQRRNGGAAHKETIYAQPDSLKAQGGVTQKVPLKSLSMKDLDQLIDPHRNERLYEAIRARLEAHGGKADKAFPADNPLRKPDRDGALTGPIVRSVTVVIDKLSGIPIRGGIAKNDTMLRVDVFKKSGKFYLVPVYVHHKVSGLPNRAVVGKKPESEWTLIDEDFEFCFTLFPNDLLRVVQRKGDIFAYYASTHRGDGSISMWAHDRNQKIGKDGILEGIGVKTALNLEKFHVDVLGNIYPAPWAPRRDCQGRIVACTRPIEKTE